MLEICEAFALRDHELLELVIDLTEDSIGLLLGVALRTDRDIERNRCILRESGDLQGDILLRSAIPASRKAEALLQHAVLKSQKKNQNRQEQRGTDAEQHLFSNPGGGRLCLLPELLKIRLQRLLQCAAQRMSCPHSYTSISMMRPASQTERTYSRRQSVMVMRPSTVVYRVRKNSGELKFIYRMMRNGTRFMTRCS